VPYLIEVLLEMGLAHFTIWKLHFFLKVLGCFPHWLHHIILQVHPEVLSTVLCSRLSVYQCLCAELEPCLCVVARAGGAAVGRQKNCI